MLRIILQTMFNMTMVGCTLTYGVRDLSFMASSLTLAALGVERLESSMNIIYLNSSLKPNINCINQQNFSKIN